MPRSNSTAADAEARERRQARDREMRRARRHSWVVRVGKIILPVCAIGLFGLFGIEFGGMRSLKEQPGKGHLDVGRFGSLSREGLAMINPRYEGYSQDGSRYEVVAAKAITDVTAKKPVKLEEIRGRFTQTAGGVTHLQATRGTMDTTSQVLQLGGGIRVDTDTNMTALLNTATIESKIGRITSQEPVLVTMPSGQVRANTLEILQKTKVVTFGAGVVTQLKSAKPASASDKAGTARSASQKPTKATSTASLAQFGGSSDQPVDITSQTLVIKDNDKHAAFAGGVTVKQDATTLTAASLDVTYFGTALPDPGSQPSAMKGTAATSVDQGRLKRIVARDNVVIVRGTDRVTSPLMEFDAEAEFATLTGGVTMTSEENRRAASDRAELDGKTNIVVLTGRVVVTQLENELRGTRLVANNKLQTLELTASDGPTKRIWAKFHQPQTAANPAKAPETQSAAVGMFRTTPGAPVVIESARLDADDRVRRAIFRGDVKAIQGDMTITTDELTVAYKGGSGLGANLGASRPAAAAKPGGAGGAATQLEKIKAKGKVVVSSGPDQKATGDWADFDVAANTVTVGGDVVLTQGRQIIRGPKLLIDVTTGLARMVGSPELAGAPSRGSAKESASSGQCGGRMCAIFYPDDVQNLDKTKPKQQSGGGWGVQTKIAPR